MKTVFFTRFFTLFLLCSFSAHAAAQQWYRVEVVVFEQLNTYTDEKWPQRTDFSVAPLSPHSATNRIQPTNYKSLTKAAARLNQSGNYRVHYHQSWTQPIMTKRRAQAINIQSNDGVINGSIKFFKGTYLHAALDLWLMNNNSSSGNPNLVESRRVRSKKLYLFDHPKMGALVQLIPLKAPAAAAQKDEKPLESFSLPAEGASTVSE